VSHCHNELTTTRKFCPLRSLVLKKPPSFVQSRSPEDSFASLNAGKLLGKVEMEAPTRLSPKSSIVKLTGSWLVAAISCNMT
jgi:hypothetical protein